MKRLKGNQKPPKCKPFHFPFRFSHGHLKHVKSEKPTIFWDTQNYNISFKRSWKCCSMVILSKTSTETLPLTKPKNPETIPSNMVCQRKVIKKSGVLYIVEKKIKCRF